MCKRCSNKGTANDSTPCPYQQCFECNLRIKQISDIEDHFNRKYTDLINWKAQWLQSLDNRIKECICSSEIFSLEDHWNEILKGPSLGKIINECRNEDPS